MRGIARVAFVGALVVVATAPSVTSAAGATLPNNSVLLYRPSGSPNALRVTVPQGGYNVKGTSTLLTGWTAGAVSRDTMILYNKNTGKAVTGTFKSGVWKPLNRYTLGTGYDQIV